MGLGLAGIIVIFLALPGILLTVFTRLGKEDSAPPVIMDAGWKVLATALVGAFLINFATLGVFHVIATMFSWPKPSLVIVGTLAGVTESSDQIKALENLQQHIVLIVIYWLMTIVVAAVIPRFFSHLLPKQMNRLERMLDDLFSKNAPVVIWMTIAMEFNGEIWLFAGIYDKHQNNKAGEPEYMLLQLAKRRRLVDDNLKHRWTEIPGESLILHLDGWHSVNVDAMYLQEESESDGKHADQELADTPSAAQPA
jgi:hypothetical protein